MSHQLYAIKKLQSVIVQRSKLQSNQSNSSSSSTINSKNMDKNVAKDSVIVGSPAAGGFAGSAGGGTTNKARTRHSDQPLSPLQRRILEPDAYDETAIPIQRIELSSSSPAMITTTILSSPSSTIISSSVRGDDGDSDDGKPAGSSKDNAKNAISTAASATTVVSIIPFSEYRHPLYQGMIVFGCCDLIGLFISVYTDGSHYHLDLIGTGAFAIVAGRNVIHHWVSSLSPSLPSSNGRSNSVTSTSTPTTPTTTMPLTSHGWISSIAIWIWASKLALFLTYRACSVQLEDGWLKDLLNTTTGTLQFWCITWISHVITSLPYLIALSSNATAFRINKQGSIFVSSSSSFFSSWSTIVGCTLYIVGLAIETIADGQKWVFKESLTTTRNDDYDAIANAAAASAANNFAASQFCNVGLWKWSQHPNFVGNFTIWIGIFAMNLPGLIDTIPKSVADTTRWSTFSLVRRIGWKLWTIRKLGLALLSPLFLWLLFTVQANGTITAAKTLADVNYGNDPTYVKYVHETPLMFPSFINLLRSICEAKTSDIMDSQDL